MLIGELVPEALNYLRENPAVEELRKFKHVLVDEYQDLNRAEQVFLDLLASEASLAVIGDEDQSIYSFKHAHPEGISTFHHTHDGTYDENLGECRRCPTLAVEMANCLIANNRGRTARALQPWRDNPRGEIHIVQWKDMDQEAEGIAQFIKSRIVGGEISPGHVLVLAPRRNFGYAIRDALNRIDAPAHSFFNEEALEGNPKLTEDCQAAEAFTLLVLLTNPEDRVALRCWCGFGSDSLRSGAWARLREHCEATGVLPRTALQAMATGELQLPNCRDLVNRYVALESRLSQLQGSLGPILKDSLFPENVNWSEPIRAIASSLTGDDVGPSQLLEWVRSGITQPEMPTDVDYVRVMSLHKSKGLTADLVVVVGCIEGAIPRRVEDATPAEQQRILEEQRRLFYVAVTRPKKTLVLSSITRIPRELAHKMGIPLNSGKGANGSTIASRFLKELGPSRPQPVHGEALLRGMGSSQ